jgi:hypothetical protein
MNVFTATFKDVAVTALQDLFSLVVGADAPVTILSCTISQQSDYKDAEDEGLLISIVRGNGTVGSGGSAPTPRLHSTNGGAAIATVRANDTTEASVGSEQDMHLECWNVRMPWVYRPTPEEQFRVDTTDDIVAVRLLDVPIDELTVSGTLVWKEG